MTHRTFFFLPFFLPPPTSLSSSWSYWEEEEEQSRSRLCSSTFVSTTTGLVTFPSPAFLWLCKKGARWLCVPPPTQQTSGINPRCRRPSANEILTRCCISATPAGSRTILNEVVAFSSSPPLAVWILMTMMVHRPVGTTVLLRPRAPSQTSTAAAATMLRL